MSIICPVLIAHGPIVIMSSDAAFPVSTRRSRCKPGAYISYPTATYIFCSHRHIASVQTCIIYFHYKGLCIIIFWVSPSLPARHRHSPTLFDRDKACSTTLNFGFVHLGFGPSFLQDPEGIQGNIWHTVMFLISKARAERRKGKKSRRNRSRMIHIL